MYYYKSMRTFLRIVKNLPVFLTVFIIFLIINTEFLQSSHKAYSSNTTVARIENAMQNQSSLGERQSGLHKAIDTNKAFDSSRTFYSSKAFTQVFDVNKTSDANKVLNAKKALEYHEVYDVKAYVKKRLELRRFRMISYCKKKKLNHTRKGNILVDDKRKFIYCFIHKVGSSAMKKALINSTGVLPINKTSGLQINNSTLLKTYGLRYLSSYKKHEQEQKIKDFYKVIFVRNPFHRLLSAFRDRFQVMVSREVFRRLYGREIIRKYRRKPSIISLHKAHDVKFVEFAQYVVDEVRLGHRLNSHWMTYQDSCHPCYFKYNLIGHLETMDDDVSYFMNQINATRNTKPSKNFGPSSFATKMSTETALKAYYSTLPDQLIKDLYKVYEDDFVMFGFSKSL